MSSVPLAALAIQQQQPSPLEEYGKVMQLRSLANQQQLQQGQQQLQGQQLIGAQQENQQRALQLKSQQGLSQALIDSKGNKDSFLQNIQDPKYGVLPTDQLGIQEKYTQLSKALADTDEATLKAAQGAHDQITQHLDNVTRAAPEDQAAQYTIERNAILRDPTLSKYAQQIPPQFPGAQQLAVTENGMKLSKQIMDEAKSKAELPGEVAKSQQAQQEAAMTPQQRAAVTSPTLQSQADYIKQHPTTNGHPTGPSDYEIAMKKIVPAYNFNLQNQLPGGGASGQPSTIAKSLADGSIKWQDVVSNRTPIAIKQQLLSEVKGINPNFNSGDFSIEQGVKKEFTSGDAAKSLTAFNTAIEHAKQLSAATDALTNGDIVGLNKIGNALGYQFGSDKMTNFNVIKNALTGEVSKVFKGGGATDAEISQVQQPFNAANSPQQLKGAIAQVQALMESKREALQAQYQAGVKAQPNFGNQNTPQNAAAPKFAVGQTVKIKGQNKTITAVHPDGSFDAN